MLAVRFLPFLNCQKQDYIIQTHLFPQFYFRNNSLHNTSTAYNKNALTIKLFFNYAVEQSFFHSINFPFPKSL